MKSDSQSGDRIECLREQFFDMAESILAKKKSDERQQRILGTYWRILILLIETRGLT